jgi:hypothetical protein
MRASQPAQWRGRFLALLKQASAHAPLNGMVKLFRRFQAQGEERSLRIAQLGCATGKSAQWGAIPLERKTQEYRRNSLSCAQ